MSLATRSLQIPDSAWRLKVWHAANPDFPARNLRRPL
jgi:hypothetical protein